MKLDLGKPVRVRDSGFQSYIWYTIAMPQLVPSLRIRLRDYAWSNALSGVGVLLADVLDPEEKA